MCAQLEAEYCSKSPSTPPDQQSALQAGLHAAVGAVSVAQQGWDSELTSRRELEYQLNCTLQRHGVHMTENLNLVECIDVALGNAVQSSHVERLEEKPQQKYLQALCNSDDLHVRRSPNEAMLSAIRRKLHNSRQSKITKGQLSKPLQDEDGTHCRQQPNVYKPNIETCETLTPQLVHGPDPKHSSLPLSTHRRMRVDGALNDLEHFLRGGLAIAENTRQSPMQFLKALGQDQLLISSFDLDERLAISNSLYEQYPSVHDERLHERLRLEDEIKQLQNQRTR